MIKTIDDWYKHRDGILINSKSLGLAYRIRSMIVNDEDIYLSYRYHNNDEVIDMKLTIEESKIISFTQGLRPITNTLYDWLLHNNNLYFNSIIGVIQMNEVLTHLDNYRLSKKFELFL